MIYAFDEYELDTALFELRCDGSPVALEPQVFSVLAYLVEHHDRVVTKTELFDHVWGDRFISEAALTSRLMAARKALRDSGQEQRYIKTIHGRGYRFVGNVVIPAVASPQRPAPQPDAKPSLAASALRTAPGRERELTHLRECLDAARAGVRSLVFVTGEAGLGKSTLIDAFLSSLSPADARIAVGNCVEQRGVGEPYMPAIEALSRLVAAGDPLVLRTLVRRAPTWLLQTPWLLSDAEIAELRERALGNTSERMLREAAEAIEELSTETPLVFVLEDLHWADRATLDLINWIGRRKEPARLLFIGSYRPVGHDEIGIASVQRELRVRGLSHELSLPMLTPDSLRTYLESRVPGLPEAAALVALLHERTDGNPLFARAIIENWLATGALRESGGSWQLGADLDALRASVPESLRGLIADRLAAVSSTDHELLDLAAVAGSPFSSAPLAAVLGRSIEEVEGSCEAMRTRGGMLKASDEPFAWPGYDDSGSYEFVHGLYEEVVYGGITPARRARLHQALGQELERAAGDDADVFAVDLARHFRLGRDSARAIHFLRVAAEEAMFRGAHREGGELLREALDLLPGLADESLRTASEAEIQALLAGATIATQGFGSADAELAYKRAMQLTSSVDDNSRRAGVVFGLAALLEYQAKHAEADLLLQQIDQLGIESDDIRGPYHALRSCSAFHRGLYAQAVDHGEAGLRLRAGDEQIRAFAFMGEDPVLGCREWSGQALWFMGYPDSAAQRMDELVELAAHLDRRYGYASALSQAARVHQMRLDPAQARARAEEATAVAQEYGFTYHLASSKVVLGWALVALEQTTRGLDLLREGLALHKSTGALMDRPYYLCLYADALHQSGDGKHALAVIGEALELVASSQAPFFYEPELHRLRGQILHELGDRDAAESAVRESMRIAESQQARSLQLRSAITLVEVSREPGAAREARAALASVLASFSEGAETVDQRRARDLLSIEPQEPRIGKRTRPS